MLNEDAYVIHVKIAISRGRATHCLQVANTRDVGKSVRGVERCFLPHLVSGLRLGALQSVLIGCLSKIYTVVHRHLTTVALCLGTIIRTQQNN